MGRRCFISSGYIIQYKSFTGLQTFKATSSYLEQGFMADYPGFEFNGYSWSLIHDVILVYKIVDEKRSVHVEACYYANKETSHEIFWGNRSG